MNWTAPYSREALHLPDDPLETNRLLLRKITREDWPCIWEMESDPKVMRYIVPHYTDPVTHREEFLSDIQKGERYKFFYTVAPKSSGRAMGWILLRPTRCSRWVELGYRIVRRAWGMGLIPEACEHLLRTAAMEWGLTEVSAVLEPENKKSARVAEKLGMEYVGMTSEFYDDINLALYRRTLP